MKINVVLLDGSRISLEVEEAETVENLKKIIAEKANMDLKDVVLGFRGEILKAPGNLPGYDVVEGTTIRCLVRHVDGN